jgi:hypothetical protein
LPFGAIHAGFYAGYINDIVAKIAND